MDLGLSAILYAFWLSLYLEGVLLTSRDAPNRIESDDVIVGLAVPVSSANFAA